MPVLYQAKQGTESQKKKSVLRRTANSRRSQKSQFKPLFRDLKIHRLSLCGRHSLKESNPNEGGSWSAVTGPLEVRKSTWLRETKRAGGRRERKEQGSLEDRSRTSGEEEYRGREGEEE